MKRYAYLWLGVTIAGTLSFGAPEGRHKAAKTMRRQSVVRCNGYDIVIRHRHYIPVRMHRIGDKLSRPEEPESEKFEFSRDRLIPDGGFGAELHAPALPSVVSPRKAAVRDRPSALLSSLREQATSPWDALGDEGLSRLGWLADGVFAAERATEMNAESRRKKARDMFLGDWLRPDGGLDGLSPLESGSLLKGD